MLYFFCNCANFLVIFLDVFIFNKKNNFTISKIILKFKLEVMKLKSMILSFCNYAELNNEGDILCESNSNDQFKLFKMKGNLNNDVQKPKNDWKDKLSDLE